MKMREKQEKIHSPSALWYLGFLLCIILGTALFSSESEAAEPAPGDLPMIAQSTKCNAYITKDGKLYCWGDNKDGELGCGDTKNRTKPVLIDSIGEKVSYITFGEFGGEAGYEMQITAAITESGNLYCWGSNTYGQVGNGTVSEAQTKPVKVTFPENTVISSVSIGGSHVVALTEDGDLYAWGNNKYGQLGNGTTVDSTKPIKVLSGVSSAKAFSSETDVIMENGDFYCWGSVTCYGSEKNLFMAGSESLYEPASEPALKNAVSIEAACTVLTENGDLYRWGGNSWGVIGDGTRTHKTSPYKVSVSNVISASVGECCAAAVTSDGSLYVWGSNYRGQIGNGSSSSDTSIYKPQKVNIGKKISSVVCTYNLMFALTYDGEVYTWGGTNLTPKKISFSREIVLISGLGLSDGCAAQASNGQMYCWGENTYGQIGNGTTDNQLTPYELPFTGWFEYPEDAWGFTNSDNVFETDEDGDEYNQGYQISKDDLQRLISHLTETEAMAVLTSPDSKGEIGTAKFKSYLNLSGLYSKNPDLASLNTIFGRYDEWGGSCYGMSFYAALRQQGIRSISELGSSAKLLENVEFSDEVESAINFYQAQQLLPYLHDEENKFMKQSAKKQLEQLESLALDAQNGGMPVVVLFQWYETNDGSDGNTAGTVLERDDEGNLESVGHVVIGYGVQYSEKGFSVDGVYNGQETYPKRIKIYDPSAGDANDDAGHLYYLYFDDEGHWYIPGWHAHSSTNDREEKLSNNACFALVTASEKIINAVDYQTGKTSFSDNLTGGYLTFSTNSNFKLIWNSQTWTIKDGIIVAGTKLNIIDNSDNTDDSRDSSSTSTLFLPESDASYTITSDEPLSFTLYQGDYFEAVSSAKGGTVTIGENGSVSLENAKGSGYQIMLTANDSPLAYSTAYVSGTAEEKVSVLVESDGIHIGGASSADTENMSVAFAGRTDSVTVPETAYKGSSEVTVKPGSGKQIIVNNTVVGDAGTDSKDNNNGGNKNAAKKKIPVSKITLSGISKKIAAGKKIKLTAKITPSGASNKSLTWKSSNTKVATVSQSGVVKIKKGTGGKTVTITATAKDGSGKKASWKIKVAKGIVKKIKIRGAKSVKAGKSLKLKAKVTATKGANKKLRWTSSNTKYAAVSQSGKVKTKKAGKGKKVKITAQATDGSGKKKTVTIKIK